VQWWDFASGADVNWEGNVVMKVLNFGSMNIDSTYFVEEIVTFGETIASKELRISCGGKGLNQSIALAKTGTYVYHAGCVGTDGDALVETLRKEGVNTDLIQVVQGKSGHSIIQVDKKGQNCIIVEGGANRMISTQYMQDVLEGFEKGDCLILQNEINDIEFLIRKAHEIGMTVVLNPSPFDSTIDHLPLQLVDIFVVNKLEGKLLAGAVHDNKESVIAGIREKYPNARVVLTLGGAGACYFDAVKEYHQPVFPAEVVDTTGAGDTFLGYFVYGLLNDMPMQSTLRIAAKAASIAVSVKGTAEAIPDIDTVLRSLELDSHYTACNSV
jgi:ribokinase